MTVNSANDPLSPASVIFLSDISYNTTSSYPGWYYRNTVNANFVQQPPIDPSNHPGPDGVWQARVSNRVYADGHIIAYRDFRRPNVTAASGYWCKDYYTYYY